MVLIEHSTILNQIIEAYKQDNRIVIKKTDNEETFEAQSYHARLDNTYTSSPATVYSKITSFLSEHRTQFTLNQLSELNRVISSKINQINARTTGLFAIILLFFNKSRRQQLMNEHRALTQLRTTVLSELNTPTRQQTPPHSYSSTRLFRSPQHETGLNGAIPPAPPLPPPPPPPAGLSTAKPPLYRALRPNPAPVLEDEPVLVQIPTDRLPTNDEVAAFDAYIKALEEFWKGIKAQSYKLDNIQTQKDLVNEKIEHNQKKIDKSTKGIKALSSQTSEDVIFLKVGQCRMPFITQEGCKKFPNQENDVQPPSPREIPSTPDSSDLSTPPSSPTPLTSNWSGQNHPTRMNKKSLSVLAQRLSQNHLQNLPTPSASPSSTSPSTPSLSASHRQFTTTSMLEILDGVIRLCETKIAKYKKQLEDMDTEYKAIEESFKKREMNDICGLVKQKDLYIDTCRKFIEERKGLLTGKLTRKPSTTQVTRPKKDPTNLSEADRIIAEVSKFQNDSANNQIGVQMRQLAHMDLKDIVKQFNRIFLSNLSEE